MKFKRYGWHKVMAVVLALFASLTAYSEETGERVISTKQLVEYCADKTNIGGQSTCNIYLQGVYDFYLVGRDPKEKEFICVKQPGPTRQAIVDGFVSWTRKHQPYQERPAAEAILTYLTERFPCESNPSLTPAASGNIGLGIEDAKEKCTELGYKKGTEQFGRCVLKLSK